jgi:hypothetical protein
MFGLGPVPELLHLGYGEFIYLVKRVARILEEREKERNKLTGFPLPPGFFGK